MNGARFYGGLGCGTCVELSVPSMNMRDARGIVTDHCPECNSGDAKIAVGFPKAVDPSPATHAILTVLKAGESVFQTLY